MASKLTSAEIMCCLVTKVCTDFQKSTGHTLNPEVMCLCGLCVSRKGYPVTLGPKQHGTIYFMTDFASSEPFSEVESSFCPLWFPAHPGLEKSYVMLLVNTRSIWTLIKHIHRCKSVFQAPVYECLPILCVGVCLWSCV